jgi:ribosome-binding protein aMBF1 (putative translation factor)
MGAERKTMRDAFEGKRRNRARNLHSGSGTAIDRTSCVCEENAEDAAPCDRLGAWAPEGVRFVTKRLQTIKKKMLADREVRAAYDALADEFDLARELIAARVRAGLTQAEVVERMGTTQSVVARLESGAQMPSVNTLLKFAKATRSRPIIKLLAA